MNEKIPEGWKQRRGSRQSKKRGRSNLGAGSLVGVVRELLEYQVLFLRDGQEEGPGRFDEAAADMGA